MDASMTEETEKDDSSAAMSQIKELANQQSDNDDNNISDYVEDPSQALTSMFECQTLCSKIVSKGKNQIDVNILIQVERHDAIPVLLKLLKSKNMTCKIPELKVEETKGKCEDCNEEKPQCNGDMMIQFEMTGKSKCMNCVPEKRLKTEVDKTKMEETQTDEVIYDSPTKDDERVRNLGTRHTRQRRLPAKLKEGIIIDKKIEETLSVKNNDEDVSVNPRPARKMGEGEEGMVYGYVDLESMYKKVKQKRRRSVKTSYDCNMCGLNCTDLKEILNHVKQHLIENEKEGISNSSAISDEISDSLIKAEQMSEDGETQVKTTEDCFDEDEIVSELESDPEYSTRKHQARSGSFRAKTRKRKSYTTEAEKPFKCTLCEKSYPFKKTLRRHERIIHGLTIHEQETANIRSCKKTKQAEQMKKDNDHDDEEENIDQPEETDPQDDPDKEGKSEKPFKCSMCDKTYPLLKTLRRHENQAHSTDYKFNCTECDKGFHLASLLRYHMMKHSGERPFKCEVCDKSFCRNCELTDHMKSHSEESPFKCKTCDKSFSDLSYLKIHKRTHTGDKPYQCDQCGKCFRSLSGLSLHSHIHSQPAHKCHECGKMFMSKVNLTNHVRLHTGERPFMCDVCGKKFLTKSRMNRHRLFHTDAPFKCGVCGKGFYSNKDLKEHMLFHSGVKSHKCDQCDKTFFTLSSKRRHMLTHSEQPTYVCDTCGKSFPKEIHLRNHQLTHGKSKPFVCEKCGKGFLTMSYLRSHYQTHEGYRPHKCDICGRLFRSVWYMNIHRKTHTGDNLHQCLTCGDWFANPSYLKTKHWRYCKGKIQHCNICNRGFSKNQSLQAHLGYHSGERPHMCDICGIAFTKVPLLLDHRKRHTEASIYKCEKCLKMFKRMTDLRKHQVRYCRELKKTSLPESLKPGFKVAKADEDDILRQAVSSIRDGTTVVEIHEIDAPGVVTEQVVLTTIDPSQLGEGTTEIIVSESMVVGQHYFTEESVHTSNPTITAQTLTPVAQIQEIDATSQANQSEEMQPANFDVLKSFRIL